MAGYVYFFRMVNKSTPIKIGKSINHVRRIKELQSGSPERLTYVASIYTHEYANLERALHYAFAKFRLNSEWFNISADIALALVQIWNNLMDLDSESDEQRIYRYLNMIRYDLSPLFD